MRDDMFETMFKTLWRYLGSLLSSNIATDLEARSYWEFKMPSYRIGPFQNPWAFQTEVDLHLWYYVRGLSKSIILRFLKSRNGREHSQLSRGWCFKASKAQDFEYRICSCDNKNSASDLLRYSWVKPRLYQAYGFETPGRAGLH